MRSMTNYITEQYLLCPFFFCVYTWLFNILILLCCSKALQDGLRSVKTLIDGAEQSDKKRRKLERSDDLDCTLCLKLLHQPLTTPCGHSFCRGCLLQALDHGELFLPRIFLLTMCQPWKNKNFYGYLDWSYVQVATILSWFWITDGVHTNSWKLLKDVKGASLSFEGQLTMFEVSGNKCPICRTVIFVSPKTYPVR